MCAKIGVVAPCRWTSPLQRKKGEAKAKPHRGGHVNKYRFVCNAEGKFIKVKLHILRMRVEKVSESLRGESGQAGQRTKLAGG